MARLLVETGLLIQHVPRTGGTFVERVIQSMPNTAFDRWLTHQDVRRFPKKHALLGQYDRAELAGVNHVACFVRHPIAYYRSAWMYMTETRSISCGRLSNLWRRWKWHPFRQAALLYKPDFAEWVEAVVEEEPGWATRLMSWYVGPEHGEFCDFIGRTESLVPDLIELLTRFGYGDRLAEVELKSLAAERINSTSGVARPDVPQELADRIEREERVLIRRFYGPETADRRWYRRVPRFATLPAPGRPSPATSSPGPLVMPWSG